MMFYVCCMVISCQTVAAKDRVVGNKYVTISTSHARICKLEANRNDFYAYYLPADGTVPTGETIPFSVSPTADYTLTSESSPSIAVNNSAAWSVSPKVPEKMGASGKIFVRKVLISITPEKDKPIDGEGSFLFKCIVNPSTLNPSYEWLASEADGSWRAGAGNSPCLNYETPSDPDTFINRTRWYPALKNSPWLADNPLEAPYSVNCKVTIDEVVSKTTCKDNLIVCLPKQLGLTFAPSLRGITNINTSIRFINGVTEYYVTDIGGFHRKEPSVKINVLETSCFHKKATVHEQSHFNEYTNDAPWKDLYQAQAIYSQYIWFKKSVINKADLITQIQEDIISIWRADINVDKSYLVQSEMKAYTAGNAQDPQYLNIPMDDVKNHIYKDIDEITLK